MQKTGIDATKFHHNHLLTLQIRRSMPQDYSHRNLQQESFIGQDLTGANFTGADIRGTDFSNAILINTNFTQTQAGLPQKLITDRKSVV